MKEEFMYPVGDFSIEVVELGLYKLVLFLNIREEQWQGINDPAVYMYKYGMTRGQWIEKEAALEMITGYDGVRYVMMFLNRYKGMDPSMIDMMGEVLSNELEKSYKLV